MKKFYDIFLKESGGSTANNKLSPVTVYVPVKGRPILDESYVAVIYGDITTSDWETVIKPEERFVFTKEELQWLLQNTFNAGVKYQEDYFMYLERGVNFETPNQTEYIQSLF